MILYIFLIFWFILFLVFTWLAFSLKSIKAYLTGCIVSLLYFTMVSEAIVYALQNKIPVIGFLVDPFPGNYKLLVQNFLHHLPYFIIIIVAEIFFFISLNKKIKSGRQNIITNSAPQE